MDKTKERNNRLCVKFKPERQDRCDVCKAVINESELLVADNPFCIGYPRETIRGCPTCCSVETFRELCEVAGCDGESSYGGLIWNKHRVLCFEHCGLDAQTD